MSLSLLIINGKNWFTQDSNDSNWRNVKRSKKKTNETNFDFEILQNKCSFQYASLLSI